MGYERPLMRYDHYCRWLKNCIALWNHRPFMSMLIGLVIVLLFGVLIDMILLIHILSTAGIQDWQVIVVLFLHLLYSMGFGYYVIPIFRLHVGFISRNELGYEWKKDFFYVVEDRLTGSPVWVGDLDEDEFDDMFDSFQYDKTLNQWDKGCLQNCFAFWF